MITLALALCFSGFYFFYSTSQRAVLGSRSSLQQWVTVNNSRAKLTGSVLLFLSFVLCLFHLGAGAGTFSFLIMLMTIASLVIVCAPLRFFKGTVLGTLFLIVLFVEVYSSYYAS